MVGMAAVVLVQNVALAKTAREVNQISQAITVKIGSGKENGSGVLLQKNGDLYTVLTAAHVVKDQAESRLVITTNDDQQYRLVAGSVRRYQGDVDLAIVMFRSNKIYKLAELGNSNLLQGGVDLYVAGFPAPTSVITESLFVFQRGQVVANSKRALKDGYGLIYDNKTLPGMSGGPVLDETGQVVGIHGKVDREEETSAKTGFNVGIPIARFADIAGALGVETGARVVRTVQSSTLTADDYFVSARQKNENGDYQGALADYNQAIALKPDDAYAYLGRGILKYEKLNDVQRALADYNQAITLKPDYLLAYTNRGILKDEKLNDVQGALADYNKAIALDPDYALAYNNRGILKDEKLNDDRGALADYNKAIALKPDYANAYYNRGLLRTGELNDVRGALADYNKAIALKPDYANAYYNRGLLKRDKLNDAQGSITDFRQAAKLYRQQGRVQDLKDAIDRLRFLGTNE
jgi:S1-C subfamily serine protease/lipoprotein NlpI